MNRVLLQRFCNSDQGTFGTLILPNGQHLATVERPWLNNARSVSCIPIGTYQCEPSRYNRGGYNAVEITGVEDRTRILFHRGNYVRNSKGCVLVNTHHGAHGQEWCGWGSKNAFSLFMREVGRTPFKLIIANREAGVL